MWPIIKFEISSRNQNTEKHIHVHCELDSFPKFKGFPNEIGGNINECIFFILYNKVYWHSSSALLLCLPSCSPNCPKPKCYQLCFFNPLKIYLPYYSGITVSFQYLQNLKQILHATPWPLKKRKNSVYYQLTDIPKAYGSINKPCKFMKQYIAIIYGVFWVVCH